MNKWLAGFIVALFLAGPFAGGAKALVVDFYTDRAAFEAELQSSTVIGFEGIVAANEAVDYTTSMTDVDFSGSTLRVVGTNPPGYSGAPYASAHLGNAYRNVLTADLTTAGSGFNAVGGWFGNVDYLVSDPTTTTLNLWGTGGLLDTRSVATGDMGAGSAEVFYGWIVGGDEITSVSHQLFGGHGWEGLDDLTYGFAPIPEPGTVSLLALALLGVIGIKMNRDRG